jgi:hypothetical protein
MVAIKRTWLLVAALLCLGVLSSCAQSKSNVVSEKKSPAMISDWNNLIDEVEIFEQFNLKDYKKIIVEKLDTSSTPLPAADDNTYQPTSIVLKSATEIFLSGIKESFAEAKYPVEIIASESKDIDTKGNYLIIRGKVTEMEPGSQALRYWISFGAGKSRVEISGNIVDARTGKPLLAFVHARSSGIGALGGDYQSFLTDDTHDVGEDVGKMLLYFQGKNP